MKALLALARFAGTARADDRTFAIATMDGPLADPCKVLLDAAQPGNTECASIATAKLGATKVAVYLVGPDITCRGRVERSQKLARR